LQDAILHSCVAIANRSSYEASYARGG